MHSRGVMAPIEKRANDGVIEYTIVMEMSCPLVICPIQLLEWDYNKRLRILLFFNGEEWPVDHTCTCPLRIKRSDGQYSSVEPLPYEDGTNCLVYEFTEFFAEVPGVHYLGITFKDKEPDEKGVYGRMSTWDIPLEIIDGPFEQKIPDEILNQLFGKKGDGAK